MTKLEDWIKENKPRADKLEEMSVNAAVDGVKALLLLNGSACIAILGFLASTMGQDRMRWSETLFVVAATKSLGYFALGAGASVGVSVFAYLSNQRYSSYLRDPVRYKHSWVWGDWLVKAGLLMVAVSLGLFGRGVYLIWDAVP